MRPEQTHIFSDGLKLGASFFWPDDLDPAAPREMVIACSGFTGLRHIHPERFARCLTQRGHPCFAFDYRGFGDSEGVPRRVLLEAQVRDIIHAAAYVAGDERVNPDRLFLLGWGMAGGLVIDAARQLPGIAGIIAVNGFYSGPRVQLAHRGADGYRRFCTRVDEERRQRSRTGVAARADLADIYPLDPESREYVDNVLRPTTGYHAEDYSFEMADSVLRWNVEVIAGHVSIPLLIAHGDRNRLHPVGEAESLYRAYGGPRELFWIEGAGHTEFMHDDDPKFQALGARIAEWIETRLAALEDA